MNPGERTALVTFQRGTPVEDDYTSESHIDWNKLQFSHQAWAKITYGTGQERREAAQESASQVATIMCLWTPALADVGAKDRAIFGGSVWDITAPPAPIGLNKELHFTVTRSE